MFAARNAMMWSTWAFVDAESQMSFQSTADANIIYDAPIQMGVLTSADAGMCVNAAQSGYYDAANSALAFTVPTPPVSNTTLAGYPVPAPRGAFMADYINSTWENADACPRQYPALEWRSWEPSVLTNTGKLAATCYPMVPAADLGTRRYTPNFTIAAISSSIASRQRSCSAHTSGWTS
jgi:hypothetical protein